MVIIKARVLRQAVSARPVNNLKIIRKKPSLGRVAVSALYDNRHGKPSDM